MMFNDYDWGAVSKVADDIAKQYKQFPFKELKGHNVYLFKPDISRLGVPNNVWKSLYGGGIDYNEIKMKQREYCSILSDIDCSDERCRHTESLIKEAQSFHHDDYDIVADFILRQGYKQIIEVGLNFGEHSRIILDKCDDCYITGIDNFRYGSKTFME
eukprot:UN31606